MSDLHNVSSLDELSPLTDEERERLGMIERAIGVGLKSYYTVGSGLREVNERRLYRETHRTFEDYAADRLGLCRGHAYNLMGAADATDNLASFGDRGPTNEFQLRPLYKLDPEQQRAAWQRALDNGNGKRPTHDRVKAVVEELVGNKKPIEIAARAASAFASDDPSDDYLLSPLADHVASTAPASVDLLLLSIMGGEAEEAVAGFARILTTSAAALKADHQILLFTASFDFAPLVAAAEAKGYEFGVPLVVNTGAAQEGAAFSFANETSFVLHFRKGTAALQKRIGNVVAAAEDTSVPFFGKPLELIEELIDATVPPGAVVLDPTAGAAATVAACRRVGRRGIGTEANVDRYEQNLAWLKSL